MGTALADLLVELSSPRNQIAFKRDPRGFLDGRPLTEAEKDALMNAVIPFETSAPAARGEASALKLMVELSALPHLVEMSGLQLMVESAPQLLEGNASKLLVEQDAVAADRAGWLNRIFIDESGRQFRLESV